MVRLQAASLTNRTVTPRKRKRKEKQDSTTDEQAQKPRRSKKSDGNASNPNFRNESSSFVESTIPWPEHFTKLQQVYRALNLVYTFCCTRKQFATTFENIKSTVEGHIKRELLIDDVAQIQALVPRAINFGYVDEAMLQVNLMGSEDNMVGRRANEFRIEDPSEREKAEGREVLLFEFVDGDMKRQVQSKKTGEPTKVTRTLRGEDLKMPVFSQKQMMNWIEKRNTKFKSAVNQFLNDCAEQEVDPVSKLLDEYVSYLPIPSKSRSTTPGPSDKSKLPSIIPSERKSIPEIVAEIKSLEWYTNQIVPDGHRVFDPQPPIYGDLKFELSQNLVNAMYNTRNITQLYAHQAEAINNLHDGHNVIVSTSTSSGKSLIYQIPVLHELEQQPDTRAMYIFPTKALAQDQRRSLKEMLRYMPGLQDVLVETFDGDTAFADRNYIRDAARIIFTNPDMLHITILPQEEAWRTFLKNLKYVVVDELHVYNGLFGSHVAFIMRRLRRICAAVGNRHVKFISCSATVSNPEEHMKTIFGVDQVKLTDFDGSPSGRKEFLCWNTPFKDPGDPTSGRGDTFAEAAKLFCQLILRGVRVIAFCRVRKQCEALISSVKTELNKLEKAEVMNRVMAYRGGYTPQDRRQIEKEMFDGKLVGIVATNALELGVDIGSLDAVLTVGFPYTIANLRQQSGRAGRRNKDSLSVLVGDSFPTDQYFMQNPDEIFTKPNAELQVDLDNMLCLEGHVQCAAYEMPIRPEEDELYFGPRLASIAAERLRKDPLGFYHTNERFLPRPSQHVTIRDTEEEHFAIIDTTNNRNVVLEDLEASRAFFTIYEGGIFLHQGNTYLQMIAKVEHVKRDYTDAIRRIPGSPSRAFYGPIRIKQVVFGFFKVDKRRRVLDAVSVDNPPIVLHSRGMWLDILKARRLNVAAGIHAAEHAVLSLMPNFVISLPDDEFAARESSRKRPARLTFYDAKGGSTGAGISTKAFDFAAERLAACHCAEGCLECCCSERCKEANAVMSKAGAEVILRCLLNWDIDEGAPMGIETVVPATERVEVVEIKREGGGKERVSWSLVSSVCGTSTSIELR
ncbi:hypothetical protein IWX49DRAFT_607613 [Phyllosticta citricarpa]